LFALKNYTFCRPFSTPLQSITILKIHSFIHLLLYKWATYQILTQGGVNQDKQTLIKIAQDTDYTQINDSLIRTSQVSDAVPHIAPVPEIREHIRNVQHQLASTRDVVVEGRDIGTVVFPQAECKIFLTGSAEVREYRRSLEIYRTEAINNTKTTKSGAINIKRNFPRP
jgi:cytidylate kinase